MMKRLTPHVLWPLLVLAGAPLLTWSSPAFAQAEASDAEAQARELFERGRALYRAGDYRGAADTFERAYQLVQYSVILFNLGLSYDKLGDPVQALEAMEKVVANPGRLQAKAIERAKTSVADYRSRVAVLSIECSEDGAEVYVSGRLVGATPLEQVHVAPGDSAVNVDKAGFLTAFHTVKLTPGGRAELVVELDAPPEPPANIKVDSRLVDAEIYVDGKLFGRTPSPTTISVASGAHRVEVRRAGYRTAAESVTLGPGASAELQLHPEPDPDAILSSGGQLRLALEPADATILIDGVSRDVAADRGIRLAPGTHTVVAERTGYETTRHRVDVPSGGAVDLDVFLPPTPETRTRFIDEAESQATIGYVLGGLGLAVAGAGVGLLVAGIDKRSEVDAEEARLAATPECNPNAPTGNPASEACQPGGRDLATGLMVGGGIGIGVAAVGLVTGIVLLATAEDTAQWEIEGYEDEWGRIQLEPLWELSPRGTALGVRARF